MLPKSTFEKKPGSASISFSRIRISAANLELLKILPLNPFQSIGQPPELHPKDFMLISLQKTLPEPFRKEPVECDLRKISDKPHVFPRHADGQLRIAFS